MEIHRYRAGTAWLLRLSGVRLQTNEKTAHNTLLIRLFVRDTLNTVHKNGLYHGIADQGITICQHEPFSGAHVGPGMLGLFFRGTER